MFIVLSGSSGSGKNTIIKAIESETDEFKLMPTFTTRGKREGEINGKPYYFVSVSEFQNKIKNEEMLEYEFIHTNYYGSSKKIIEEFLDNGKIIIKDIGIEGAKNISGKLSSHTPVLTIFLTTTKKELKKRLKLRGEKQIKLRLKRYKLEQAQMFTYDYLIYNNNLENTKNLVIQISKIEQDEFLSNKLVDELSLKKIKNYVNKLNSGKIIKPIKIAIFNGQAVIEDGQEKFIAGLLTGKKVCKEIYYKESNINQTPENIMEWKRLVRESTKD